MKRYAAAAMVVGAMIMSFLALPVWAEKPRIEKAVVQFDQPVKLLNVMLKGEYLFVHDEDKMAQGEDCTHVYTHSKGRQGDLVVSFHCIPVVRDKADGFVVVVTLQPGTNLSQIEEYRFAGSSEGHKVPLIR